MKIPFSPLSEEVIKSSFMERLGESTLQILYGHLRVLLSGDLLFPKCSSFRFENSFRSGIWAVEHDFLFLWLTKPLNFAPWFVSLQVWYSTIVNLPIYFNPGIIVGWKWLPSVLVGQGFLPISDQAMHYSNHIHFESDTSVLPSGFNLLESCFNSMKLCLIPTYP